MAVEVRLPTLLRTHTDGEASLPASGATVGEVFSEVVDAHPGLKGQLIDDAGSLHKFVNVYVNDDDIRYLDQLDTKVGDGDVISILPAVAGGSHD
jgi:molybdopterin synthase sulfur carrier subunit